MSSVIESTLKALTEFESELDAAKAEVSDARKKLVRDAVSLADAAKASAMSKAQGIALERTTAARAEAEKEADAIRKKGADDLKSFEGSISRRKSKAADWVAERLLGAEK